MKNYFKIIMLALATMVLTLSSCKKDDPSPNNEGPNEPPIVQITSPHVTTTLGEVTPQSINAFFAMNEYCSQYTIMLSEAGTMQQWMHMFGASLEECIKQWGVRFESDTSFFWGDLTPATDYLIYIVAEGTDIDGNDTLTVDSVAVRTATLGGSGLSTISIDISDITSTSAVVTCTPNEETAWFKDMLITVKAYNEYGADSAMAMLKSSPYTQYSTDIWTWQGLEPATDYYALAIGQNANGEWGTLAIKEFRTEGK